MRRVVLAVSAALLFVGCAGPKEKRPTAPPQPALQAPPQPTQQDNKPHPQVFFPGKVVRVNLGLSYAILNFPIGTVPHAGQRLSAYRSGRKVGELKVNGPQGDENAVADITDGQVDVGDEVRAN